MQQYLFNDVANAARGHWPDLLSSFGIYVNTNGAHTACPVCGGKDRFRFDNKNGNGTWFCNQCDPQAGTGIQLVANVLGLSTLEAVRQIAPMVGVKEEKTQQEATGALYRWKKAQPADPKHPYLVKKNIAPLMLRQEGSNLLIPVVNQQGDLSSLQTVNPEGVKKFAKGYPVKGCFCRIAGEGAIVMLCEGFATGATLHQETGFTVFVAFNANNLKRVAKYLKKRYRKENPIFVVAGDNDQKTPGNPGLKAAYDAAKVLSGIAWLPDFKADKAATDWNDHATLYGAWAVNIALDKELEAIEKEALQNAN